MKVALLSNINADFVLRLLAKKMDCVPSVGYGDVWGQLLDSNSSLNRSNPDVVVLLTDIEQLVAGYLDYDCAVKAIDEWYLALDTVVEARKDYYISDVMFRSEVLSDNDSFLEERIINFWSNQLEKRVLRHTNIHVLKINNAIYRIGKAAAFSKKMWYMGKIPYTNEGCKVIAEEIENTVSLLNRTPKKVLVLDLDNTLWGGVLGELGVDGIELSDNHIGSIYKTVQQQIKAIKETGIILAIVSKNNESDVKEVWDKQPYMFLKRNDFVSVKINWVDKADNIQEIAKELNLGVDSFVFIDDTATERENIKLRLPEVIVPDFPDKIENYPAFMESVFNDYFRRTRTSAEDKVKTKQYAENALREESSKKMSFQDFLVSLNLEIEKVDLDDTKLDRIAQMHGKTNQFNLTTIRYTRQDIDHLLKDGYKIYAYNVKDKFGDYGLVAVAIVDCEKAEINSFLMSCRVMGKLIENYIIDEVERDFLSMGYTVLRAKYLKTAKNAPVEKLFDGLGYRVISRTDEETDYEINLQNRPARTFFVNG
ncbi:MAG: HAD-IIIC family phosphatase [Eubacteriales bacterium]|nr:HAD-IIIC family phosphatase [Eubacteriales bacterium]